MWTLKPAPSGSPARPSSPALPCSLTELPSSPSLSYSLRCLHFHLQLVHFLNSFIWGTVASWSSWLGFLFPFLILSVHHPQWDHGDPAFFGDNRFPLMIRVIYVDYTNIRQFRRNEGKKSNLPWLLLHSKFVPGSPFLRIKIQTPRLSKDPWDLAPTCLFCPCLKQSSSNLKLQLHSSLPVPDTKSQALCLGLFLFFLEGVSSTTY